MNDVQERPAGPRVGTRRRGALALVGGLLLTALATLGIGAAVAPPAGATATKCAFYGQVLSAGVGNGSFCTKVVGSGPYIETVSGNFGTTIPGLNQVCNPSIKIDVYDRYGRWLAWRQGAQKTGCTWGTWNSVVPISVYWRFAASNGFVRVSLQSYGSTVAYVDIGLGA